MTQWSPIWRVEIDGTAYTNAVLANLSIRTGRTNIYEQAQAGYCNIQVIDLDQATIPVSINSSISIEVQDTSGTYVPIFGGSVVDIAIEVRDVGSTTFTQTYSITARVCTIIFCDVHSIVIRRNSYCCAKSCNSIFTTSTNILLGIYC